MRTSIHKLILGACVICCTNWVRGQWLFTTIAQGPYVCGYKNITARDAGRPFSTRPLQPRILPVHVWYPAISSGTDTPLKFAGYVNADKITGWTTTSATEELAKCIKQYGDSTNASAIAGELANAKTNAIENAIPATGKYPTKKK